MAIAVPDEHARAQAAVAHLGRFLDAVSETPELMLDLLRVATAVQTDRNLVAAQVGRDRERAMWGRAGAVAMRSRLTHTEAYAREVERWRDEERAKAVAWAFHVARQHPDLDDPGAEWLAPVPDAGVVLVRVSRHAIDPDETALDDIAHLCGCVGWDYPGQLVRDVHAVTSTLFAIPTELWPDGAPQYLVTAAHEGVPDLTGALKMPPAQRPAETAWAQHVANCKPCRANDACGKEGELRDAARAEAGTTPDATAALRAALIEVQHAVADHRRARLARPTLQGLDWSGVIVRAKQLQDQAATLRARIAELRDGGPTEHPFVAFVRSTIGAELRRACGYFGDETIADTFDASIPEWLIGTLVVHTVRFSWFTPDGELEFGAMYDLEVPFSARRIDVNTEVGRYIPDGKVPREPGYTLRVTAYVGEPPSADRNVAVGGAVTDLEVAISVDASFPDRRSWMWPPRSAAGPAKWHAQRAQGRRQRPTDDAGGDA